MISQFLIFISECKSIFTAYDVDFSVLVVWANKTFPNRNFTIVGRSMIYGSWLHYVGTGTSHSEIRMLTFHWMKYQLNFHLWIIIFHNIFMYVTIKNSKYFLSTQIFNEKQQNTTYFPKTWFYRRTIVPRGGGALSKCL